jgi:ribosomal-protein-alanine acetyltransferase
MQPSEQQNSTLAERVITVNSASLANLDALLALEQTCFSSDRLSSRSFRRFLTHQQAVFLIACDGEQLVGYCLILFHRGTRLARLYSIAVAPDYRGAGIAKSLMRQGELKAQQHGAFYYRLEVNTQNHAAIRLYLELGFKEFALIKDYYQDHSDALRMQKRIRHYPRDSVHSIIPWLQQSTQFTCGPASLMMAFSALTPNYQVSLAEELELWREATTIFMTSGHGGCHPLGLALAASARGFNAEVWINTTEPLFVEGVRSEQKKQIISTVHQHFVQQASDRGLTIHYDNILASQLKQACDKGAIAIVLISTYRMDRKKAPHWVVVSGYDDQCFYLHDPYPNEKEQDLIDCQYMPIAEADFERMSVFGANRMRTALILSK